MGSSAPPAANERCDLMLRQRPLIIEVLTAAGLIAAPFILPYLGFTPTTVNRILVWGLFGLGFDILFGFTGLLSFGQSAFFGTGGMVAAYLLTVLNYPDVITSVFVGMIASAIIGLLVGLIALRRTGIYFAMITVAIAEVFFFVEFNPLSAYTGGENGLPGVPTPILPLGFTTLQFDSDTKLYSFLAFWYFIGLVIALRIVRSPIGAILRAIRDNPLRAAAVGHNIHGYKLTAFVVAAAYAGFAGGLLGIMQGFMPPDAFTFDTSGQLVMQTAIGGAGTLFGPLVGAAVWLYLSDFLQTTLHLGATWKLVLGIVFVLLVCFLRHGLIGGVKDLYDILTRRSATGAKPESAAVLPVAEAKPAPHVVATAPAAPMPALRRKGSDYSGPILEATLLTKRYGGLVANSEINFSVQQGERRGKFRLDLFRRVSKIPGLSEQVEHTLALVNLTERAEWPVASLAYGEKRRLEVGLALASSPSLLLLDEPLAGMSPLERVEMVKLLRSISQGRTMIIVDHDMDSLFELVERVTVLQEGRVLVEGTPAEIKGNKIVQEAYLGGVMAA
jgi:branched-chain amino acid transport system permease protein